MSLYEVLKASKAQRFPDYWTQLWGRKLSASMIKTITGTLPLTFTTHTAGAASDWAIEGNDESYQMFPDSVGQQVITIPQASTSASVEIGAITLPAGRYTIHRYQANTLSSVTRNTLAYNVDSGSYVYEMAAANYHLAQGWYSWSITLTQAGLVRFRWWVADNGNEVSSTNFILTKGETTTPDHYIPYQQGVGEKRVDGYYVPLTISQTGQPDKNYDIYIGGSPLTAGQSISKTSTGVDLELSEGENTISTTIYNKPEVEIKYK